MKNTYRTPVLYFKREKFADFLAEKGIDTKNVFPPIGEDPLDFKIEVAAKNFSFPFIMYDIDLSSYTRERKAGLISELNKKQPDFFL